MAVGIGEVKTLFDLAHQVQQWLASAEVLKAQRAAKVIAAAGVLLAALHVFDNRLRKLLAEVNLLSPPAGGDDRRSLLNRINEFANGEEILPVIRQYSGQLINLRGETSPEDWDRADEILSCARRLMNALGQSVVTPFADVNDLRLFLAEVKNASTPADIEKVIGRADGITATFERKALANADEAFGHLKGQIIRRHPGLSEPPWTAGISLIP